MDGLLFIGWQVTLFSMTIFFAQRFQFLQKILPLLSVEQVIKMISSNYALKGMWTMEVVTENFGLKFERHYAKLEFVLNGGVLEVLKRLSLTYDWSTTAIFNWYHVDMTNRAKILFGSRSLNFWPTLHIGCKILKNPRRQVDQSH